MAEEPTTGRNLLGDIAPKLAEITDKVLFGDIWSDPALSPRDRSLVTITVLTALYRTNELPFHLKLALANGLTKDEIVATLTHVAFYAGWPCAVTGLQLARTVFEETGA
ncbi:MAG: carboxymuconolactone decarboxylase family protein [Rhodospirillales bacterium]|nr:carboxymuconolactone decarboxylase family protein [Rhodospirillales bacterium]